MERVVFLNKSKCELIGIINKPVSDPRAFIVMVHGFTGNKDEKGLFVEANEHFAQNGFSTFRFDMTGCGDSGGDFSDIGLEDQKEDLLSAISFLKEKEGIDDHKVFILGFSLGATVSVKVSKELPNLGGFIFWSPAFFPDRDMYPRYQIPEILTSLSEHGYFFKSGIKVGKKLFNDLRDCNLVPLLQDIHKPTLIVHGEEDERISVESSRLALPLLNGWSSFESIPRACHSFRTPHDVRSHLFSSTIHFLRSRA